MHLIMATIVMMVVMIIVVVVVMKVIMKFEWRSDLRLGAAYQWNTYDRLQVCFSV